MLRSTLWKYDCISAKNHRKHITSIDCFIFHMCVSYRWLNTVNKPVQFLLPQYNDTITVMSWGPGDVCSISLDALQVYHQVVVFKLDWDKLAFFAPDDLTYLLFRATESSQYLCKTNYQQQIKPKIE